MQIGTVTGLYRYPVKGMGAEPVEAAELGWFGLEGDRRFAFVQSEDTSDFPWLTIRQLPALTRYIPDLSTDPPTVRTPSGRELALTDPELTAELAGAHGKPVHLLRSHRGVFDAFAVSILSTQTVAAVGALAGRALEPERFRPNIVIDAPNSEFLEDTLIDRVVTIGGARVRVNVRDKRCMVINFDPHTAERDPAVLRAAARHRDTRVGVYGSAEQPGTIRVGDPVLVN